MTLLTENKIMVLGAFFSGRFDDPTDGCVLTDKSKRNSLKSARKSIRRWEEVLRMNGYTIVKQEAAQ